MFIFQIDGDTGETITYVELFSRVKRVRGALWQLGMRKGDTLLVFSTNNIHIPVVVLAVTSLGGVFTAANYLNVKGCVTKVTICMTI